MSPKPAEDPAAPASEDSLQYDLTNVSVAASPLASEKLCKKIFRVLGKAARDRQLRRGTKEVVKAIRKSAKGIVVLAGDCSPLDVISHIPVLCEENGLPYIFVPQKSVLGLATGSKRSTSCLMIVPSESCSFREKYGEIFSRVSDLENSTERK